MESFVIKKQKSGTEKKYVPDKPLERALSGSEYICVHGVAGVGKSCLVKHVFPGAIYITHDVLRSKQATLSFLEKLRSTDKPVVIENLDIPQVLEMTGWREIVNKKYDISPGKLVVVTTLVQKLALSDAFKCVEVVMPTDAKVAKIGKLFGATKKTAMKVWRRSRNNLHVFTKDVEIAVRFGETLDNERDWFKTPLDMVQDLSCVDGKDEIGDYIGKPVEEHGFMVCMLQENYVDGAVDDTYMDIADALSRCDVWDSMVYGHSWDFMPYFTLEGILRPAYHLGHSLDRDKLRPGSAWTRYSNMVVKINRMRAMARKNSHFSTDPDFFVGLYELKNADLLAKYNLTTQDLDMLNHMSIDKLKTRQLKKLKERLTGSQFYQSWS
jgi:hypothetical protein